MLQQRREHPVDLISGRSEAPLLFVPPDGHMLSSINRSTLGVAQEPVTHELGLTDRTSACSAARLSGSSMR